jgi:hypothetical protein
MWRLHLRLARGLSLSFPLHWSYLPIVLVVVMVVAARRRWRSRSRRRNQPQWPVRKHRSW